MAAALRAVHQIPCRLKLLGHLSTEKFLSTVAALCFVHKVRDAIRDTR